MPAVSEAKREVNLRVSLCLYQPHLISLFFSVPFWQPPRWKRPLTQQPIGPKRQRGEKKARDSFIPIHSPSSLVFLPLPLASRLSFLSFSPRFLVL